MSYRFLPYVTLPSRITNFSMTWIDHIFVRLSHKYKAVNMISGVFHCDISDHLLCFISIKHTRLCNARERPLTRLFDEMNSAFFVQKMEAQNWDDIYSNTEDYYNRYITAVIHISQQSFPIVRMSRKRWHDKPWMTAVLKASTKRKNLLYNAYLMHPSDKKRDNYNNCKNILRGVLKQAQIQYYENLFDEHKDSFYMWKSLFPIINPKKVPQCLRN